MEALVCLLYAGSAALIDCEQAGIVNLIKSQNMDGTEVIFQPLSLCTRSSRSLNRVIVLVPRRIKTILGPAPPMRGSTVC